MALLFSYNRVRVIREFRVIRDNVIRVSHVSRVENTFPSVIGVYTAVYPLYTSYPHSFDWTVWTVWIPRDPGMSQEGWNSEFYQSDQFGQMGRMAELVRRISTAG